MKLINSEIRIENSSKCNAHCSICPREKMTRPKVIMPNKHFYKLVDEAKELGAKTISVFGFGEPILDKELAEKIKYCTSKELETFITTNAGLLTSDIAFNLLNAGLSHIRFSVHGIFASDFERVHKGLNFIDVIRNIFNFVAINRVRFFGRCKISGSVIQMADENINDIRTFWQDKCDWLEIWRPHDWAGARSYRTINRRKRTCGRPFNGPVQINADGKVMVCCFDFDAKLTVGDTYKNTIEEILKGEPYEKIREAHKTGNLDGLVCEKCDQLNEGDTSLLYSSRDPSLATGITSSTKFRLMED